MTNHEIILGSIDKAIQELADNNKQAVQFLLLFLKESLSPIIINSARYELFRTACIDKSSFEHAVMASIEEIPDFGTPATEFDAVFDRMLASVQAFKDAAESVKS